MQRTYLLKLSSFVKITFIHMFLFEKAILVEIIIDTKCIQSLHNLSSEDTAEKRYET